MLKLYGGARSRASIVRWYLEELAIPYEFILVDMAVAEHHQPEFLKLNPFGKVPVITDGDFVLFESGAILLYLNQKYGQTQLTIEQQAILAQWSLFANSTLAQGLFTEANRERELPILMTPLNELFAKQPYLLGDEFSVGDVVVGSMLNYAPLLLKIDLSTYPAVVNYTKVISKRPAFKAGMSR
jgi:glutathione S-transferase